MASIDLHKVIDKLDSIIKQLSDCTCRIKKVEEPLEIKVPKKEAAIKKISKDQLSELHMELDEYPKITKFLFKGLNIKELSEIPKDKYLAVIQHIRKQKIALMNSPKKEW